MAIVVFEVVSNAKCIKTPYHTSFTPLNNIYDFVLYTLNVQLMKRSCEEGRKIDVRDD